MNKVKEVSFYVLRLAVLILKNSGLHKLTIVKRTYGLALKNVRPEFVLVDGKKIFLDQGDSLRLSINSNWEPFLTSLFRTNLAKGDTFVDIGAHIGYYSSIASDIVGVDGKIYAFEPDRDNFELLQKNIKTNHIKNIISVNEAIVDKIGLVSLSPSGSKANPYIQKLNQKSNMRGVTLDSFFKNKSERISLIKIDIEGSEAKALIGMRDILFKNATIKLFLEFWPFGLKRSGNNSRELLALLKKHRFKLFEINENKKTLLEVNDRYLLRTYIVGKRNYTNLFCRR